MKTKKNSGSSGFYSKNKNEKKGISPNKNNPAKSQPSTSDSFRFLNPQNIFLLLASVFGLCFIFTIPPFQIPDEGSHMFRAYQLTQFHLKTEEQNNVYGNYRQPSPDNKVIGTYLPANFDSAQMQFAYLKFQPRNKTSKKDILNSCSIKLEPEREKFTELSASNYSYFSYIPQIPAIIIGRILKINVIPLLYLGRLFALAFYILCVWYSIKILPHGKNIILALGLIPMSLTLAGSYQADCVVISFSFLAVALSFHLMSQQGINFKNKNLILLITVLSLIGVLKIVYFPFVLMILLIPKRAYESIRTYYSTLLITFIVSTTLTILWTYIISNAIIPNPSIVIKEIIQTPSHQKQLLVNNPLLLLDILQQTLSVKGEFYYKSLIGILGYLDTMLPNWIYKFYFFLLILVALFDNNKSLNISLYQRTLLLLSAIGIFVAVILAMFIFDGVESKDTLVVEGVQGRYLIPAFIAIIFTLYGILPIKNILGGNNKIIPLIIFVICFIILYQTERTLYLRYFKAGNDYFKYISG